MESHLKIYICIMESLCCIPETDRICKSTLLQFSSVQSLSCVWLFVTSWTAALQVSMSITNTRSLLKLMSIVLVMPSNHLILCRPLLLPPSIFPSIRVFSNESVHIRWPRYWSFSFSTSPSSEYSGRYLCKKKKTIEKTECIKQKVWTFEKCL